MATDQIHADPVSPGQVIANKYRIESTLGSGGFGIVTRAWHLELDQPVALKFLNQSGSQNPDYVRRLFSEARAAAALKSQHVARVHDVGKTNAGIPFIVMEFLDGLTLEQLLTREGAVPVQQAVGLILQTCDALAEAHAVGLVHRDIKPANLFLTQGAHGDALLKVLDFGIAKRTEPVDGVDPTRSQRIVGSPRYMAPEQMEATVADARTDIWALGVTLYELVAGSAPFDAPSLPKLCAAVLHLPPAPLDRGHLPAEFVAILHRCLRKKPADRYASIAELACALLPFAPNEHVPLAKRLSRGATGAPLPSVNADETLELADIDVPDSMSDKKQKRDPGQRIGKALLVASLAGALGAGGIWYARAPSPQGRFERRALLRTPPSTARVTKQKSVPPATAMAGDDSKVAVVAPGSRAVVQTKNTTGTAPAKPTSQVAGEKDKLPIADPLLTDRQ